MPLRDGLAEHDTREPTEPVRARNVQDGQRLRLGLLRRVAVPRLRKSHRALRLHDTG